MTPEERAVARTQAQDMTIARGTDRKPGVPRDISLTSGPRGILVNWRAPANYTLDVAGYRVYKDDETKLFQDIRDPLTTQCFVEATAGTTPPTVNVFVSTISKLGRESAKIQAQGSATAETGAPTMPSTPPTYTVNYSPQQNRVSGGDVKQLADSN